MKLDKSTRFCLLVAGALTVAGSVVAAPVGSAFSYQGLLRDGGSGATGSYDLRFTLWTAATGAAQVGAAITNSAVTISNGLFTVALDFGPNVFDGNARWLEIGVRQGTNDFTLLTPRQSITPAPYALIAANVANPTSNFVGTFTGSFVGDGSALTNLSTTAVASATNDLWSATTNWVAAQGYQGTNTAAAIAIASPAPFGDTNFVADFASAVVQITATNDINFVQSTNRPASGSYSECVWYIQGGTTDRTLRINTNWTAVGTLAASMPYLIASNKLTIVALAARGESETNVTYAIARQE